MTNPEKYFIPLLLIGFCACTSTPVQHKKEKLFTVDIQSLKGDTIIRSAVYFNHRILCLRDDHKIFVLDTLLKPDTVLSQRFAGTGFRHIFDYNDSILIEKNYLLYYLDSNFSLHPHNKDLVYYWINGYDYSDEDYHVYSCSAGEWGGSVFFLNKKTNKTFSYPATGVQQVFKFNDTYVVSNFLAHMSGFSDYLFIKDPAKLYELKDKRQKHHCNWYSEVDSLKSKAHFDRTMPAGVSFYADNFITNTLATFPWKNDIYSIYCTDSATILAKFENLKLIPVDTLLNRRLTFSNANTHLTVNKAITAYSYQGAAGSSDGPWIHYQNTGLVYIRENKITFLEFQTPHMRISK